MIPEVIDVSVGSPEAKLEPGELLVVVGAPGQERTPWVQKLIATAVKGLSRHFHYLHYHVGFLGGSEGTPYAVLEWKQAGQGPLERRWLAHKVYGQLAAMFNLKQIAVYLEPGSAGPELALAEDLWTRHMRPRYERSHLSRLRLLTSEGDSLHAADPYLPVRLKAQLGFRQWVNENPDELTSIELGHRLASFCGDHGCTFESLGRERLAELGMNLLLAVGQASARSPSRLHIATHGLKPGLKPLLLIGKGITFDTGGINLKPHEGFVNCMKNDMGGAALMIQLFMALVESGYSGPLAVAIPCCENLIDAKAMKPGAIIRAYNGKDVIIEHTDAEGRLILADAITYTQKQMHPALTLTAATLTTASLRQFSNYFTPVHFASAALQDSLTKAGKSSGEEFTFWGEFLPFLQGNSTNAADLTNMGRLPSHASIGGGSSVAAHFLKQFAVQPLVHLDIFASTWNWSGDYPGAHYGATGAPFNALFRCLRQVVDPASLV
ncbi:MAG: M17 family metallopeptidase [Proteobacteria bacterium]|nr:M17 family metallopeptidase [Pseudomonadota bacterium]